MNKPTMPIPDMIEALEDLCAYDYANYDGQTLDFLMGLDANATMAVIQSGDALKRLKDKIEEIRREPVTEEEDKE